MQELGETGLSVTVNITVSSIIINLFARDLKKIYICGVGDREKSNSIVLCVVLLLFK